MKKFLFPILFCFIFNNVVFSFENSNINNNFNTSLLGKIENEVFGKNNNHLSPMARLALTEQKLFGSIQPGSFNDRINFINKIIINEKNNSQAVNISNLQKSQRLKYSLNNFFKGYMTGYTPPIYVPQNTLNEINNYYHNTKIPQPNGNGIKNFITQTRVIINNDD
ncbi:hypothetical protein IJG14_01970 [bacterium]|nr:hypothetical protein [bacterium]